MKSKQKKQVKVLVPEWESHSRDSHIMEPVTVFLEEYYGYKIIRTDFLFILFKLIKYRPDVLLIANAIGAGDNVKWCHFAKALGIKTIALTSEGLWFPYVPNPYRSYGEFIDSWVWGDNYTHESVLDLEIKWNEKSYLQLLKKLPADKPWEVRFSGATGFDRYKLLSFENKAHFLQRFQKQYKTVVLVIGYGFYDVGYHYHDLNMVAHQAADLCDIYSSMISAYPDILFILKTHPANLYRMESEWDEFQGLRNKFDNVLAFCNEEDISNLLNVADLIISYDSTVALEGWLLGKESLMINPFEISYLRTNVYKGNPIVKSQEELYSLLDEFQKNHFLRSFQELSAERDRIIKENIFSSDGANFIRASKLIHLEIQKDKPKKRTLTFKEAIAEGFYEVAQFLGLLFYRVTKQTQRYLYQRKFTFDVEEEKRYRDQYRIAISEFEKKNSKLVDGIINNFSGEMEGNK